MKLLLALLVSFTLHAQNGPLDASCIPIPDIPFNRSLLNWFSVVDQQMNMAPCKTKSVPSEKDILSFIRSHSENRRSAVINGVQFENEPLVLIKAFEDLTTLKDAYGIGKVKISPNIQNEFKINPECLKVQCAMERIWGKEASQKMLYIKLKHQYNTSELAFKNSSRFRQDELNDVLLALEDLPEYVAPSKTDRRLVPFTRGYTLESYASKAVAANAFIMLFDHWSNQTPLSRQYSLMHEFAHNISSSLNDLDQSPEWLSLSGWKKIDEDSWDSHSGCFVSDYAEDNPWEDFAESFASYRYNGAVLKKRCPEKYAYLKNKVFKDVEYIDENSCN